MMAGQNLPPGTALPIEVGATLNAKNAKPGQKIEGKLMQEVRLPSGAVVKKGSRVIGQVISVQKPSHITVQFKQLQDEHQTMPLNVSLRAIAGPESVFNAGLPIDSTPDAESSQTWITKQVGGDVVNRGRGLVGSDFGVVGHWTGNGVWGKLQAGGNCSDSDDNGLEQSLWVFSSTACGAYGFDSLSVADAGRTPAAGQITLQSSKPLLVRGGSGWLLVVNSAPSSAGSNNP